MSPVGFAVIFGNENTSNWTKFWEDVLRLHPSMNSGYITIITDKDKRTKKCNSEASSTSGSLPLFLASSSECYQDVWRRLR
jgi:hypothetical protein